MQQKLTQESFGRLAQPWLAHAEAPGQSAWLRSRSSCFLPQLALLCLALLSLPSLSITRTALFQSSPIPSQPGKGDSHPPWGPQEPPFIVSLSCAVSWARHLLSLLRIPGFLYITEEPTGIQGGEETCPESCSWRAQLLVRPPVLQTRSPSTPLHGLAFLPHLASHVLITFQALLSKSLGAN